MYVCMPYSSVHGVQVTLRKGCAVCTFLMAAVGKTLIM